MIGENVKDKREEFLTSLMNKGKIAWVSVGRNRMEVRQNIDVDSSLQMFGIDVNSSNNDEALAKELRELMSLGNMKLLSDEKLKKLKAIEGRARYATDGKPKMFQGYYLSLKGWESAINRVSEAEAEYLELRDELCNNWDKLRDEKEANLLSVFKRATMKSQGYTSTSELTSSDWAKIEKYVNYYISMFPTVESYKASFYMRLEWIDVPALDPRPDMSGLTDEEKELIKKLDAQKIETRMNTVEAMMKEVASNLYGIVTEKVAAINAKVAEVGELKGKTKVSLQMLLKEIDELNIYNDSALEAQCAKIKESMKMVSVMGPDDLKKELDDFQKMAEKNLSIVNGTSTEKTASFLELF